MRINAEVSRQKSFLNLNSKRSSSMRLFCFPYAGGGAWSYAHLLSVLPDGVEVCPVQLPGRDKRIAENSYTNLDALIDDLINIWPFDKPFALFGHSMGGLISFELARALRRNNMFEPFHLLLSGCGAPHVETSRSPKHLLNDSELIKALREYGGTSDEVLSNDMLIDLFLPVIRSDLTLSETYTHRTEPPLSCPITVFTGVDDVEVQELCPETWRQHSTGSFALESYPGGHFFINSSKEQVSAGIVRALNASLARQDPQDVASRASLSERSTIQMHTGPTDRPELQ